MSHFGSGVEYGLHCLLYLVDPPEGTQPSSRDLAEFQGISPSYVAKLFTRLEKSGLVVSAEGIGGGYRLARPADDVSVLDVVDAIEEDKPLFECRDIRGRCILYGDSPPSGETGGVCSIHAVMIEAERRMRDSLAERSLADIADEVGSKLPGKILKDRAAWFHQRHASRRRRPANKPADKEMQKEEQER
jgi:Rrf2 family protein